MPTSFINNDGTHKKDGLPVPLSLMWEGEPIPEDIPDNRDGLNGWAPGSRQLSAVIFYGADPIMLDGTPYSLENDGTLHLHISPPVREAMRKIIDEAQK